MLRTGSQMVNVAIASATLAWLGPGDQRFPPFPSTLGHDWLKGEREGGGEAGTLQEATCTPGFVLVHVSLGHPAYSAGTLA